MEAKFFFFFFFLSTWKFGFSVLIGALSINFKTCSNNNLFLKFKILVYNASKDLRAIFRVSILKIIVVVTCLSSSKF